MDMYNTIFDPRVAPCDIYRKGEFAGYIELQSRVELKRYINSLFGKVSVVTAEKAFESGGETAGMTSASSYAHYYLLKSILLLCLIEILFSLSTG